MIMWIKRIIILLIYEFRQYTKSFTMVVLIILPILVIATAGYFMPISQERTYQFVISKATQENIVDNFERCGQVLIVEDYSDVYSQVAMQKGVIGIDNNTVIIGADEPTYLKNYAKLIIGYEENVADVSILDIGNKTSTFKYNVISALIIFCFAVYGMLFGLSILRERLNGTIYTLLSSPLFPLDMFISKIILPMVFIAFNILLIKIVFDIKDIPYFAYFYLFNIAIVSLIGVVMGDIPKTQLSSLIAAISIALAYLLNFVLIFFTNNKFLAYGSPIYWSFYLLYNILSSNVQYYDVLIYGIVLMLLSSFYIIIIKKKFKRVSL